MLEYRHLRWSEFIWDADLSAKAKLVAQLLASYMNAQSDIAFPSLATIQGRASISRDSAIRAIKELEAGGWLVKTKGGPGVGPNRYATAFPVSVERLLGSRTEQPASRSQLLGSRTERLDVVAQSDPNQTSRISPYNGGSAERSPKRKFTPPTVEEVRAYAAEKGLQIHAQDFVDFYESKNWMVGKSKMSKWKAAASRWARRNEQSNPVNANARRAL